MTPKTVTGWEARLQREVMYQRLDGHWVIVHAGTTVAVDVETRVAVMPNGDYVELTDDEFTVRTLPLVV